MADSPASSSVGIGSRLLNPPLLAVCDDLSVLGPHGLVPFLAQKLKRPSVIWLNRRCFAECGIDLRSEGAELEIKTWLLETFGAAVPHPLDPPDAYGSDTVPFGADRYGSSWGNYHGGSGRCGTAGYFHAKGIGRTPLISVDTLEHANGMVLLWEALLEAIGSEIVDAELPYGAVPILAIIDLGFASPETDGGAPARRAMIVRPSFLRPAHFERSIFFGDAGHPQADQYRDAQRVRHAVESAPTLPIAKGSPGKLLTTLFARTAEQIGSARAHRLWLGVCASSNRAVDGRIVDFGAVRAVPDWRAATTRMPEQFGNELQMVRGEIDSLSFYFHKYSSPEHPLPTREALAAEVASRVTSSFRSACAQAMMLDEENPATADALDELQTYYSAQQAECVDAADRGAWRLPWLLNGKESDDCGTATEKRVMKVVRRALEGGRPADDVHRARLSALHRWLAPRHGIFQPIAVRRLPAFVRSLSGDPDVDSARVTNFIDHQVSCARRIWRGIPRDFEVRAQLVRGGASGLLGFRGPSQARGILLSGNLQWGSLSILGCTIRKLVIDETSPSNGLISSVWITPASKVEYNNGFDFSRLADAIEAEGYSYRAAQALR